MRLYKTIKIFSGLCFTALSFHVAATNLIQNGSFEESATFNGKWALLTELNGWTLTSEKAKHFEVQTSALNIIQAYDGNQYLELDSTNNYGINQTIQTAPGGDYVISFYYSPRKNNRENTNKLELSWDGQKIATLESKVRGWQHYTYNVKATKSETQIQISGAGKSDSLGALIDNVKLEKFDAPNKTCEGGLYGINNYGSQASGIIYQFDTTNGSTTRLTGVPSTASNIASANGKLYLIEQLNAKSRDSRILTFDIESQQVVSDVSTNSYPIYRSAINSSGDTIRATSKTTMYDFDLLTGDKTILGKMKFSGETFKDGDIAYNQDFTVLYVLTGKALYTIDVVTMKLTQQLKHGIKWASGLAINNDDIVYVSGRKPGENAHIFKINLSTGDVSDLFETESRINDLTFVDDFCIE
jgi:hypothetical protein